MGRSQGARSAKGRDESAVIAKVLDRLQGRYGEPRFVSRFDPMEELVCCILSQHTADVNSFPAFARLRKAFPDWQGVVDAGPERIADVVRKAGLANQKAKSILNALKEIKSRNGAYSIDNLRTMPMLEAREWLTSLPGVGPKTASIVLCFSFGMGAIPVDTHVFRVSKRLGFVPESADEKRAHDLLLSKVREEDAFRYHTLFIQHGRQLCKARAPLCSECPVFDACRYKGKSRK